MSPDAFKGYLADPQSQHPYMYCKGNPVKYSDPSGYKDDWATGPFSPYKNNTRSRKDLPNLSDKEAFFMIIDISMMFVPGGEEVKGFEGVSTIIKNLLNKVKDKRTCIGIMQGIDKGIKGGKLKSLTTEELDAIVLKGREYDVNMQVHDPHPNLYENLISV